MRKGRRWGAGSFVGNALTHRPTTQKGEKRHADRFSPILYLWVIDLTIFFHPLDVWSCIKQDSTTSGDRLMGTSGGYVLAQNVDVGFMQQHIVDRRFNALFKSLFASHQDLASDVLALEHTDG